MSIDVLMPDGTTIKDVPEGTTRDQLMEKLKAKDSAAATEHLPPGAKDKFEASPAGKLTSAVGGVLDVARAGVTGVGADVAGGLMGAATLGTNALGLTHDDPVSVIRAWQAKAYPLTTEAGKKIGGAVSKVSEATVGALGKYMGRKGMETPGIGGPLLATVAELMPDAATTILGADAPAFLKEAATRGAAKLAKQAIMNTAKDEAARVARQAHFTISPSEYGGPISRTITSMSNKAEIERMSSAKNQERVVDLAKLNMEIPETAPLDRASYVAARFTAAQPYNEARQLGRMEIDPEFQADLIKAGSEFEQVASDFPQSDLAKLDTDIKHEKGSYLVSSWDANSAVDQMSHLREQASDLLRSDKAADRKLGQVKRDIATAFEDRLWRHADAVGQPDLAVRFKQARKKLAQIHVWEDSTNFATGRISSRQVVAQREMMIKKSKVDPFTDELKMVADAAGVFPKSFQDIDLKGRSGPISVFERYALISGAFAAFSGQVLDHPGYGVIGAGTGLGIAATGVAGRYGVTSKLGQKATLRTPSHKPGPIRRAAMQAGDKSEAVGAIAGAEAGNQ